MTNGYHTSVIIFCLSLFPAQLALAGNSDNPNSNQSSQPDKTPQLILAANSGQKSAPVVKKFSLAENGKAVTAPSDTAKSQKKDSKSQKKNSKSQHGQFIPSEEISEDLSVSFPIDI